MFPTINKKETGVNLRRIMDIRGVKHLHPSGQQAASRHRFRDRFSCDQP